jgi:hypothetical protein
VQEQGDLRVSAFSKLEPFIASLAVPRRVMLLVPAGRPVESAISSLMPHLSAGDVIVDFGNEWYEKTEERQKRIEPSGIIYVGCGLSGGESGARHGPCMMPGGGEAGWKLLQPVLEKIAAKVELPGESYPCVRYIGPGGAGHYVKMVHNGVEYGDMQLISEGGRRGVRTCAAKCTPSRATQSSHPVELMRQMAPPECSPPLFPPWRQRPISAVPWAASRRPSSPPYLSGSIAVPSSASSWRPPLPSSSRSTISQAHLATAPWSTASSTLRARRAPVSGPSSRLLIWAWQARRTQQHWRPASCRH